jgi:membrane-bound metal-dependent hydrolase YbcI (DUF457 family)
LDNVTHTLVGATLARTALRRAGRGATAALLISSNIPDIDIVATAGGALKYLEWHRGPTHGPLGVVGLGVLSAAIVWAGQRVVDARRGAAASASSGTVSAAPAASFAMLAAISMIGVAVHVVMDLPTSYGTRVLSPFSWRWFAVDWMPIVDVYVLAVLVVGLLGKSNEMQRRVKAAIVLGLIAANYGLRAAAHHQALEVAPRIFGPTLPQHCDPPSDGAVETWPPRTPPSLPATGTRCLVALAAMPTFLSPFRWRVIAQMSNAYEVRDIDLLDWRIRAAGDDDGAPWRLTVRYPNVWTPAVHTAAATRLGQGFLGFSRFPAARSTSDRSGASVVRWSDMRFAGGIAGLAQPTRSVNPFTAIVRLGPDGRVLEERITR